MICLRFSFTSFSTISLDFCPKTPIQDLTNWRVTRFLYHMLHCPFWTYIHHVQVYKQQTYITNKIITAIDWYITKKSFVCSFPNPVPKEVTPIIIFTIDQLVSNGFCHKRRWTWENNLRGFQLLFWLWFLGIWIWWIGWFAMHSVKENDDVTCMLPGGTKGNPSNQRGIRSNKEHSWKYIPLIEACHSI